MIGRVDEHTRALLTIRVSNTLNGEYSEIVAWVDTAFDGHLVFSRDLIEQMSLDSLVQTDAVLADGSSVTLETFLCFVEWFGQRVALPVIANDGRYPLLGTGLLDQRVLVIDYQSRTVQLD